MNVPGTDAVYAPNPRAVRRDVKKDETIQYSYFALVQDGPEALGEMANKVRHRHLAAGNEGGCSGEKAYGDQGSEYEFEPAGDAEQTKDWRRRAVHAAEGAECLLRTVTDEKQADDNSHDSVSLRRVGG